MASKHYNQSRDYRNKFIDAVIGRGDIIDKFVVDKGHIHGPEVHCITDTGLIIIHNLYTGKLVTKLIARPAQIKRYYVGSGQEPPAELIELAFRHQKLGYNNI